MVPESEQTSVSSVLCTSSSGHPVATFSSSNEAVIDSSRPDSSHSAQSPTNLEHQKRIQELANGLLSVIKPNLERLDRVAFDLDRSQLALIGQLNLLVEILNRIGSIHQCPVNLEPYVHRLGLYKKRILKVHSSLRHSQDRLNQLRHSIHFQRH